MNFGHFVRITVPTPGFLVDFSFDFAERRKYNEEKMTYAFKG